jgi:hypothetical protein
LCCLATTAGLSIASTALAQEFEEEFEADEEAAETPATEDEPLGAFVLGEGFRMKSADGNYLLRVGLTAALKLEPARTEGDAEVRGSLAFVRPSIRGNFYKPWFHYSVAWELAAPSAFLLAANVEATPWDEFGARYGQQGTPVFRHTTFAPQNIFFPDYAATPSFFWAGRQRGLTVFGHLFEKKLDYWAGIYGGSPLREPENQPDNYVGAGRITANPFGPVNGNELPFTSDGESLPLRASVTVQGYHGKFLTTAENFNPANSILDPEPIDVTREMTTAAVDLWLQGGPVIVYGEYTRRHLEEDGDFASYSSQGAWGQVMVDVYEHMFGVGARANWIDPNLDLDDDRVLMLEGMGAWFIHPPEMVLKLRYAWLDQDSPDPDDLDEAPGDFELPFIVGSSHVATLQLTMAF